MNNPMNIRRRFEQQESLQNRLASFAKDLREQAALLPTGVAQEEMLRKARQADTASHMNDWINSPGLQPPN